MNDSGAGATPEGPIADALATAIDASAQVLGSTSPNPPVGAAIISPDGELLGVGATQPPGGSHAEVMALQDAGERARGAIAVVTLEPCAHTGRTGPCTEALLRAGISQVWYANSDPHPTASGGATWLRAHGVPAIHLDVRVEPLEPWLNAIRLGRPHITWKTAHTLDGFTAATDGTSQWITGDEARAWAHRDRSQRDAIIVGTGTFFADNPTLTARTQCGGLYPNQPRRVVIGTRPVPNAGWEHYTTIDHALRALWDTGARNVLVEGGATLAAAFMQQDLIDAVQSYTAPAFLCAGLGLLAAAGETTISDIKRYRLRSVTQLGEDVLFYLTRGE